jgi:hypothetical protein
VARAGYLTTGEAFPLVRTAHWLTHLKFDLQSLFGLVSFATCVDIIDSCVGAVHRDLPLRTCKRYKLIMNGVCDADGALH